MSMKVLKVEAHARRMRSASGRDVRAFYASSRVYVWPKGETILENLMNRRTRPYTEYRKLLADQPFMKGARWSRTAGCGCGCSPGFILPTTEYNVEGKPVDYHIDVGAEAADEPATYLDLVAA
jgi:hypothetical protein